jgi:hypothetical protein
MTMLGILWAALPRTRLCISKTKPRAWFCLPEAVQSPDRGANIYLVHKQLQSPLRLTHPPQRRGLFLSQNSQARP